MLSLRNKKGLSYEAIKYSPLSIDIQHERIALSSLLHVNIVKMFDFYVIAETKCAYFVLEYCDAGTLHMERVKKLHNKRFPERYARYYFQQLMSGIEYMHAMHIAHLDIKPANLMLRHAANGCDIILKIGDFGLSRLTYASAPRVGVVSQQTLGGKGTRGTPHYQSPEMWAANMAAQELRRVCGQISDRQACASDVQQLPPDVLNQLVHADATSQQLKMMPRWQEQKFLLPPCDMFAAGVTLFVMLTGVHPYDTTGWKSGKYDRMDLMFRGKPLLVRTLITGQATNDLLDRLLTPDYDARLTAKEVLDHEWMKGRICLPNKGRLISRREPMTETESGESSDDETPLLDEPALSPSTVARGHLQAAAAGGGGGRREPGSGSEGGPTVGGGGRGSGLPNLDPSCSHV